MPRGQDPVEQKKTKEFLSRRALVVLLGIAGGLVGIASHFETASADKQTHAAGLSEEEKERALARLRQAAELIKSSPARETPAHAPEAVDARQLNLTKELLLAFPNKDLPPKNLGHLLAYDKDAINARDLEKGGLQGEYDRFVQGLTIETDESSIHVYEAGQEDLDIVLTFDRQTIGGDDMVFLVGSDGAEIGSWRTEDFSVEDAALRARQDIQRELVQYLIREAAGNP